MAKSKETFNKKQKEQQRLKQKQDKLQKKEEKKANKKKGATLEDMMAYIDEYGNLSDRPPDPRNMKPVELADIQISVPKQVEGEEVMRNGVVIFYNNDKGFGFINDQMSGERIFFHVNDTQEPLGESDKVKFLTERSPRGLNAVRIEKVTQ